jgi:hypothetical protein
VDTLLLSLATPFLSALAMEIKMTKHKEEEIDPVERPLATAIGHGQHGFIRSREVYIIR